MATLIQSNEISSPTSAERESAIRERRQRRVLGMNGMQLARGLGWFSVGLGAAELLAPKSIARLVGSRSHSSLIRAYGLRELATGIGILTATRPGAWLWSRAGGDVLDLASLGRVFGNSRKGKGKAAFAMASVAGVTVLDVLCAQKLTAAEGGIGRRTGRAEASLIINRSPEECYRFWRNFENLPRFMSCLQSVRMTGDRQSHWVANVAGRQIEWDAEIEMDLPNQRLSWRSVPGSQISCSGVIEFEKAPGNRGTIVRTRMDYGNLLPLMAALPATIVGKNPRQIVRKELRRFKQTIETGEPITTEGQPAGRRSSVTWLDHIAR